ncbi:MAG: hypothetical protein DRH70_02890 [Candidatus Coatesbacteria bacterium]|nr:MAG: hypothetical protein DRH70_02890 [Candidatus Coatesbacteria bacterium]
MAWRNKDARGSWEAIASVDVAENDLMHINTDGKVVLADATSGTAREAHGFAALRGYQANERATLVRSGKIAGITDEAGDSLTTGSIYYLSKTAGKITATKPSGDGDVVQVVGVAAGSNELNISIGPAFIVASSGNFLQAL